MNNGILVGIISGLIFGIMIGWIVVMVCNKDRRLKTQYDERQQLIRGKGFKYGFFMMLGGIVVLIVLKAAEVEIPVHDSVLQFFVMLLGILGYVTYTIMHDAYFGLNNKVDSFLLAFAVLTVSNIIISVASAVGGTLIVDGKLGLGGMNLLSGIVFLWMFILIFIKKLSDPKED